MGPALKGRPVQFQHNSEKWLIFTGFFTFRRPQKVLDTKTTRLHRPPFAPFVIGEKASIASRAQRS
jgi:hypothetical protein